MLRKLTSLFVCRKKAWRRNRREGDIQFCAVHIFHTVLVRPDLHAQEQLLAWKQIDAYNYFQSGYTCIMTFSFRPTINTPTCLSFHWKGMATTRNSFLHMHYSISCIGCIFLRCIDLTHSTVKQQRKCWPTIARSSSLEYETLIRTRCYLGHGTDLGPCSLWHTAHAYNTSLHPGPYTAYMCTVPTVHTCAYWGPLSL